MIVLPSLMVMERLDRVSIGRLNERWQVMTGVIIATRVDSLGRPIYIVSLDDSRATPDGLYYARLEELELIKPALQ